MPKPIARTNAFNLSAKAVSANVRSNSKTKDRAVDPDPKPRRTRAKSGMRETLLQAAVELFGSRGYEAVSLRDVTAEVGLKAPALYNHFRSKDDLLIAAMTSALQAFNESVVDTDDPTAPAIERLDAMIRRHLLYQIENAPVAKANDRLLDAVMLDRIGNPEVRRTLRLMMRSYLDRMTTIITQVLAERGDITLNPRLCALAIGTMCDRVLTWYRPGGQESPQKLAQRFAALARNMLRVSGR